MESEQSEHLYTVLFDERQESWYVTSGSSTRICLSRVSLQHLISLYNDIHRGAQLTLIDRKSMEELGAERTELHETIRSLYDYIDAEAERSAGTVPVRPPLILRGLLAGARLCERLRCRLRRF